jgi:hypothetical protein
MSALAWTQPTPGFSFLASDSSAAGLIARLLVVCPQPLRAKFESMGGFPDDLKILPDDGAFIIEQSAHKHFAAASIQAHPRAWSRFFRAVDDDVRQAFQQSMSASQMNPGDKTGWIRRCLLFRVRLPSIASCHSTVPPVLDADPP